MPSMSMEPGLTRPPATALHARKRRLYGVHGVGHLDGPIREEFVEKMEPAERIRERLPLEIATAYAACVDGDLESGDALLRRARAYLAEVTSLAQREEFVDITTATSVERVCEALIAQLDADTLASEHRAVQAAVAYFVLADDVEDDTASVIGFDDDLLVVQATAEVLGWPVDEIAR